MAGTATGDSEEGRPSGLGERQGAEGAEGQGGGGKEVANEDKSSAKEALQSEAS